MRGSTRTHRAYSAGLSGILDRPRVHRIADSFRVASNPEVITSTTSRPAPRVPEQESPFPFLARHVHAYYTALWLASMPKSSNHSWDCIPLIPRGHAEWTTDPSSDTWLTESRWFMPNRPEVVMLWQLLKPLLIFPKGLLGGLIAATVMWMAVIFYDNWQALRNARKLGYKGPVAVAGGWQYLV